MTLLDQRVVPYRSFGVYISERLHKHNSLSTNTRLIFTFDELSLKSELIDAQREERGEPIAYLKSWSLQKQTSKQQNISEADSSATANKKLLVSAGLVSLNAEISK